MDHDARNHLFRELKRDLTNRRVIVLLGAGVSVATSNNAPVASWRGLLHHGVEHCAGFGQPRPVTGWMEKMRWLLDNGDMEDLLAVATEVERRLPGDKFRDWINGTVGAIPRVNPELPHAIHQLNVPVATTNYDDYPADITLCGAIPWTDRPDIDKWLRQHDRRHIHLHGIWRRPDSIILGHNSYSKLTADDRSQFIQKVLGTRRLLLIGYGAGLTDPNFGPLFGWLRSELSSGGRNDYLLCLETDVHKTGPFVRVPFGTRYSELTNFLRSLAPLTAANQKLIDSAQLYQAITQAPDRNNPANIDQLNKLVDSLGHQVTTMASSELFDALEDWDDGIGLAIGLVKAIELGRLSREIDRVVRISTRIPAEEQYSNAKMHIADAVATICPLVTDVSYLIQIRSIVGQWLIQPGVSKLMKDKLEEVFNSLPYPPP